MTESPPMETLHFDDAPSERYRSIWCDSYEDYMSVDDILELAASSC